MKFVKKPIVIEATQWFKMGDHPKVLRFPDVKIDNLDSENCDYCKKPFEDHGYIGTLEGGFIVCPSDWIITGIKGEHYPCKKEIFEASYDKVEEQE